MKPTRFLTTALILMGLVAMATAAGTPSGTTISNQATGTYNDANGNALDGVSSNTVTTSVSQIAGTTVGGDQAQNLAAMSFVLYDVTVTNTGNGSDTFALSLGASGGQADTYTYEIYSDLDNNGSIDGADAIVTSTGALAADADFNLLIKVSDTTFVGAPNADQIAVTLTSLSGFDGSVSAATVLTSTIQAAAISAVISAVHDGDPQPGDVLTYEVCITNDGTATAYSVLFTNLIPTNTTFSAGTIREGTVDWASGSLITDASDSPTDEGDYDITTGNTITVNLGDIAGGGNVCIYYKVTIDAGLGEGEIVTNDPTIDYDNEGGDPYPTVDPTGGGGSVTISESFGVDFVSTGTTTFTGDPGDSLVYSFTVENLGNGTDNFDLSASGDYVVWTYYVDTDGSGTLSVVELGASAVTTTGNLTQNEVGEYIAVGVIPAGTADAAADATTFTAASQGDAGTSTDTGTANTTCTAPILTLTKSVDESGGTKPGDTLTYTITVSNAGTGEATTVVVSDVVPSELTYVAESMTIDAAGKTDASDSDGATLSGGSVVFDFSTLAASGSHTLTFQATID